MACDVHTLVNHCIVEKLVVLNRPALEDLLDDMISINILAHLFDSVLQKIAYHVIMNVLIDNLNNFLDRSSSVGIFAKLYRFYTHLAYKLC